MRDLSDDQQRVVRLISKLLKLASNNPSAEEAESAQLRAQALLAEYDLTLTDLSADEYRQSVDCDEYTISILPGKPPYWVNSLGGMVMKIYEVHCIASVVGKNTDYKFIGIDPFVGVASEAFVAVYRHLIFFTPKEYHKKQADDYCFGFIIGLLSKLEAQKAAQSTCTDLVLVRSDMIQKYVAEHYPALSKMRRRSRSVDRDAYLHGHTDGQNYNFAANGQAVSA